MKIPNTLLASLVLLTSPLYLQSGVNAQDANNLETRYDNAPSKYNKRASIHQVGGALNHEFSLGFSADKRVLDNLIGLESPTVGRMSGGGALNLSFSNGSPYPAIKSAVVKIAQPPDPSLIFDPLAEPASVPVRVGFERLMTYRIAQFPDSYLILWKSRSTGKETISLLKGGSNSFSDIATTNSHHILGIAVQPNFHGNSINLIVWARLGSNVASFESYSWKSV